VFSFKTALADFAALAERLDALAEERRPSWKRLVAELLHIAGNLRRQNKQNTNPNSNRDNVGGSGIGVAGVTLTSSNKVPFPVEYWPVNTRRVLD
jgi:hypothetical protein